jgi:hypothetical protein
MKPSCRGAIWKRASQRHVSASILVALALVILPSFASYGGNLTVTAMSGFGKEIPEFRAIVSSESLHLEARTRNGKALFEGLPPGTYRIQIRSDLHVRRERMVEVGTESLWYPIVLAPDMPIDPIPVGNIRGHVDTANIDDLWLKLVSIFDDTCLHSKPDGDGNFHFRGMPPGRYLLLLYSNTKLLHQREINVGYFDKNVLTITPNVP